jgi:hypothetical protein
MGPTAAEKIASRATTRHLERPASSTGNASRSCWATHDAVGLSVTLQCTISRRECLIANHTYSRRKVAVGTVKRSMATITFRWFLRNVSQLCLRSGRRPCCRRRRDTPRSETLNPSFTTSPWIRVAPQPFSLAILRTRSPTSRARAGRPGAFPLESHFQ